VYGRSFIVDIFYNCLVEFSRTLAIQDISLGFARTLKESIHKHTALQHLPLFSYKGQVESNQGVRGGRNVSLTCSQDIVVLAQNCLAMTLDQNECLSCVVGL